MNNLRNRGLAAFRYAFLCAPALTLLAACGGGGSEDVNDPDPGVVPNPTPGCSDPHAIEGGGRQKFSGVFARLSADGGVVVSDVIFATAAAKVYIDGASASLSGLRAGDTVTVTGEVDLGTRSGCANAVYTDADITAAIDEMDLAHGTVTVLGQQIRIYPSTVLGDDVKLSGESSLQPGQGIRVTGLYADGAITATRIDRAANGDGYFVAGVVTHLSPQERTFRINEIAVQFEGASLVGFPTGAPRDGDTVRLTGTAFEAGTSSSMAVTVIRPTTIAHIEYGTPLAIVPTNASVDLGHSVQFLASSGSAVRWTISRSDGVDCSPTACGVIDSTGKYTAPLGDAPRLLITATSVDAPLETATATVYVQNLPFAVTGPHTLAGEVFSFETGVIGGADVNIWVQQKQGGYSYWWAHGPLRSNDLGLFEAPDLPEARISVFAVKSGYVQPCAVTSGVQGDVSVRVEMMPASAFDVVTAARPQLAVEPSISGVVFENTPTGRQPVAGAVVWLEETMGIPYATTMTDRSGGYFVCIIGSLPTDAWLTVVKDGFETQSVGPVNTRATGTLEIVLRRR